MIRVLTVIFSHGVIPGVEDRFILLVKISLDIFKGFSPCQKLWTTVTTT